MGKICIQIRRIIILEWKDVKLIFAVFICLVIYQQAFGDIKGWDSKYSKKEVIILEEITVTEEDVEKETTESEEEPDCE